MKLNLSVTSLSLLLVSVVTAVPVTVSNTTASDLTRRDVRNGFKELSLEESGGCLRVIHNKWALWGPHIDNSYGEHVPMWKGDAE